MTRTDPQGFSDLPLRRITRPTSSLLTPLLYHRALYAYIYIYIYFSFFLEGTLLWKVWNSKAHEFETSRVFRLYAKYLNRALIRPVVVVIRNLLIPPSVSSAFELVPTRGDVADPDPFSPLVWIRRTGILRASNSWQGSRRVSEQREWSNGRRLVRESSCERVFAECLSVIGLQRSDDFLLFFKFARV